MNKEKAYKCLELDINDKNITLAIVKRQYHIKALRYHPDKNKSDDATNKFQEISSAYEYIVKNNGYVDNENNSEDSYKSILVLFLNKILESETSNTIFYNIINRITILCEDKAVDLLEKLDKSTLIKTYKIIEKYKNEFHISENLINKINKIIKLKNENDECIILNPNINDLYENNLYKLKYEGKEFIIPLWHHELVYEVNNKDLYVNCNPILPENVELDELNNIHINVSYNINDIWNEKIIYADCTYLIFPIEVSSLKLVKEQIVLFIRKGITVINTKDIYDISKKSDVFIHITLTN